MAAGVADRLMVARQVGPDAYQLVAVVPHVSGPRLVTGPDGPQVLADGVQVEIPGTDLATWTMTVQLPDGLDLLEAVEGLDTTGDGRTDVMLGTVLTTG